MNKAQLVAALAVRLGDRGAAALAVDELLDVIVRAVHAGDSVTIPGFGVFERRERAARTGRNPQTGASMQLAATNMPAFRASATFRDVVSGARALPAAAAPDAAPAGAAAASAPATTRTRASAAPVPAATRATTPPAATQSAPLGEDAGRRQNGKAESDKSDKSGKGGKKSAEKSNDKPGKPEKRDKGGKKKRSKK